MQNCAARIVSCGRKYDLHYALAQNAILASECVMGLAPSYLSDKFATRSSVHSVNIRNKHKLSIPRYKSAAGQRTFFIRGVNLWISLLYSDTDNKTLTSFKRNLKNHLVTNFLKSNKLPRGFNFNLDYRLD